jgi:hypothetical protein
MVIDKLTKSAVWRDCQDWAIGMRMRVRIIAWRQCQLLWDPSSSAIELARLQAHSAVAMGQAIDVRLRLNEKRRSSG